MSALQRHSLDWAGDIVRSPHGDWVHYRDVEDLQDEVEALRKKVAALEAVEVPAASAGHLFGYAVPSDAQRFLSGVRRDIRLYRNASAMFCFPVSFELSPNHYMKPPVGATVRLPDNSQAVVKGHEKGGLVVVVGNHSFSAKKWSYNHE